jgi:hypothetical protein
VCGPQIRRGLPQGPVVGEVKASGLKCTASGPSLARSGLRSVSRAAPDRLPDSVPWALSLRQCLLQRLQGHLARNSPANARDRAGRCLLCCRSAPPRARGFRRPLRSRPTATRGQSVHTLLDCARRPPRRAPLPPPARRPARQ